MTKCPCVKDPTHTVDEEHAKLVAKTHIRRSEEFPRRPALSQRACTQFVACLKRSPRRSRALRALLLSCSWSVARGSHDEHDVAVAADLQRARDAAPMSSEQHDEHDVAVAADLQRARDAVAALAVEPPSKFLEGMRSALQQAEAALQQNPRGRWAWTLPHKNHLASMPADDPRRPAREEAYTALQNLKAVAFAALPNAVKRRNKRPRQVDEAAAAAEAAADEDQLIAPEGVRCAPRLAHLVCAPRLRPRHAARPLTCSAAGRHHACAPRLRYGPCPPRMQRGFSHAAQPSPRAPSPHALAPP